MGKLVSLKRNLGFTFIEIATVILLLSIFTVLSVPYFRKSYETIRFNSSIGEVISFIRMAQERVLSTKEFIKIKFEPHDNKLKLLSKDKCIGILKIPKGVLLQTNIEMLYFDQLMGEITIRTSDDQRPPSASIVLKHKRLNREAKIKVFSTGLIKLE